MRGEVTVFHHLLLAHGRAVEAFRAPCRTARIGIALNLSPHYPASDDAADVEAARVSDGYVNRWFLDPVCKGAYPDDMRARYEELLGAARLRPRRRPRRRSRSRPTSSASTTTRAA